MKDLFIYKVAIPNTKFDAYDYMSLLDIAVGVRVIVPFRNKELVGLVIDRVSSSKVKLKEIIEVLDISPIISKSMLKLGFWVATYYQAYFSQVLPLLLPKLLRSNPKKTRNKNYEFINIENKEDSKCILNAEQNFAKETIIANLSSYKAYLLNGVTGSGKTEVYLSVIEQVLLSRQVLVLVPEIGLTPQLLERFTKKLNIPMAVVHSRVSDVKRKQIWENTSNGNIKIIIGTRAAVFTPFLDLGLIIVDEEHDLSFKQINRVRYSARDTALMRAYLENIPIILGSATPSLESIYNASINKYNLLHLTHKALTKNPIKYTVVDIRSQKLQDGLSDKAISTIQEHLSQNNQVLVFINRKGYAPILMCSHCGKIEDCAACDVHNTVYEHKKILICHYCGLSKKIPKICSNCQQESLFALGVGTERIENFLQKQFPEFKILRIDQNYVGNNTDRLEESLKKIELQEYKLIVGTQMMAKGHHFPKMTLVVVIDADLGFFNQDFKAAERTGQLLTQVFGRVGRESLPGEVLIQTYHPENELMKVLIEKNYNTFSNILLNTRKQALLPPYEHLALIRASSKSFDKAYDFLAKAKIFLQKYKIHILGPAPAPIVKQKGYMQTQLLIKASSRKLLQEALTKFRYNTKVSVIKWSIDVDPIDLS